jgi:flagellar motor switch protein FliG
MTAAHPQIPPSPAEAHVWTKIQKISALLVMLGPEAASQILKDFPESEIDAIATEVASMTVVERDLQTEVLREFGEVAIHASTSLRGGAAFAQTTLEKAVGGNLASTILHRIAPNQPLLPFLQPILKADPRDVFSVIRHEQPQTIALLISYLPPEKASQILGLFPAESREQVIERLATLVPTPIEVVERIASVLNHKLENAATRPVSRTGGLKFTAELLNALEKDISQAVLSSIEKRNPDLCQAIRQKMFTFGDISRLDVAALQKILRQVETRDLALSLKNASEPLKLTLLSGMSKRGAETMKEEINFLGKVKTREIESAQGRIIEIVRLLESQGEIELNAGEEKKEDENIT